jgi:hypothetical protein
MPVLMIVTAKPPRKRGQEPGKAAIVCPVIATARKPGPRPYVSQGGPKPADDPEAEARVHAFFARMILPPGE